MLRRVELYRQRRPTPRVDFLCIGIVFGSVAQWWPDIAHRALWTLVVNMLATVVLILVADCLDKRASGGGHLR